MDLSKLSTEDLLALKSGNLSKVSTAGLMQLRGQAPSGAEKVAAQTGRGEALMVAAGRKTDEILDGLTQLYLKARGEEKALGGLASSVAEKKAIYDPLRQKYPFVTGVGEALPSLAIPATSIVGAAAAGAVPEMLSYGSAQDRLKRGTVGALGGATGAAIGKGIGRMLKPAGQGTAGLSDDAVAAAERIGYQLSPGQRSQNSAMQMFENYLARSPGSSGAAQARGAANTAALNRAAASAMGQNADDLSEGVFAAAKSGIGNEFGRLEAATSPNLGDDFLNAIAQVDSANAARGAFRSSRIDKLIDQSLDLASSGKLSGTAYKEIRSELSSKASEAFKGGDSTLGQAYKAVRQALDDAAEQSLSAADRKAWGQARAQWSAYKALTKSNVAEGGNVSPARLASALRSQGDGLRTGAMRGPLSDVARLGESLKGVPNPTSGQLNQQMLYGNPLTGIPLVAGNKAADVLYNLPLVQRYLAEGLLDVGANGQLLIGAASRPSGLPLVRGLLGAE